MNKFLRDLAGLRRNAWENLASGLIALGVVMMMQPWLMALYTWSFVVTLIGTVTFIAATKFRE
jgi:hypothetical protein